MLLHSVLLCLYGGRTILQLAKVNDLDFLSSPVASSTGKVIQVVTVVSVLVSFLLLILFEVKGEKLTLEGGK